MLLKLFHRIKREKTLPNSFHEAIMTGYQDITRTQQKKNNSPVNLIRIYSQMQKFLSKYQQIKFNGISKKITNHDQVGFILGMQRWFNTYKSINVIFHINRMKVKKSYDYLNRCRKGIQ
jgi:hypothetical protein